MQSGITWGNFRGLVHCEQIGRVICLDNIFSDWGTGVSWVFWAERYPDAGLGLLVPGDIPFFILFGGSALWERAGEALLITFKVIGVKPGFLMVFDLQLTLLIPFTWYRALYSYVILYA